MLTSSRRPRRRQSRIRPNLPMNGPGLAESERMADSVVATGARRAKAAPKKQSLRPVMLVHRLARLRATRARPRRRRTPSRGHTTARFAPSRPWRALYEKFGGLHVHQDTIWILPRVCGVRAMEGERRLGGHSKQLAPSDAACRKLLYSLDDAGGRAPSGQNTTPGTLAGCGRRQIPARRLNGARAGLI